jgi:hypothetical protein
MKNLIETTESSATYEFTSPAGSRVVTFRAPEGEDGGPIATDFESMAEAEHSSWLAWLNQN